MERWQPQCLEGAGENLAVFSKEGKLLDQIRMQLAASKPLTFKYQESGGVDIQFLKDHVQPGMVALVVLVASSSSYLWLHDEHFPTTVTLCNQLRDVGCQLRFLVRPTTRLARTKWSPEERSIDLAQVFKGFWTEMEPPILVWDSGDVPADEHVHILLRHSPGHQEFGNVQEQVSARSSRTLTWIFVVLLVLLTSLLYTQHYKWQGKVAELQTRIKEFEGEVSEGAAEKAWLRLQLQLSKEDAAACKQQLSDLNRDLLTYGQQEHGLIAWLKGWSGWGSTGSSSDLQENVGKLVASEKTCQSSKQELEHQLHAEKGQYSMIEQKMNLITSSEKACQNAKSGVERALVTEQRRCSELAEYLNKLKSNHSDLAKAERQCIQDKVMIEQKITEAASSEEACQSAKAQVEQALVAEQTSLNPSTVTPSRPSSSAYRTKP